MVSLNRYRLKRLSKTNRGARRAQKLLQRPDRLIGLILIGNNAVNILAALIAEIIFAKFLGDNFSILATTVLLTFIMLIFAEVTPKTCAAVYPEAIAFRSSYILLPLQKLLLPLIIIISWITNSMIRLFGIDPTKFRQDKVDSEELKMMVSGAGDQIPGRSQDMLMNVLDFEDISIEDIMIPRNEIYGLDLKANPDTWKKIIMEAEYTRIPVYESSINNSVGILHTYQAKALLSSNNFLLSIDNLKTLLKDPYFIPENTSLSKQLIHFQKSKQRLGFIIDEYGDIQGMATLDDLLEEIVGDYITNEQEDTIIANNDGSFTIDGSMLLREVNKITKWDIPMEDGPRTINGLIIEYLEAIPAGNVCFLLGKYQFETLSLTPKGIKQVRVSPIPS